MRTFLSAIRLSAVVVAISIAGCTRENPVTVNEQPPPGVTNEETAMKYMAGNDEFVRNDEQTFDDQAVQPADYDLFGKLSADITPIRFGRFITSVTKTITITIQSGDSIAIAAVDKDIVGVFKIRAITNAGDTVLVEKPFNDKAKRNIIFKRVNRLVDHFWRNWIPVASSLVDGGTASPNDDIHLLKVEMFLPNGDTVTITDPTNHYLRYRWLRMWMGGHHDVPDFAVGQEVKIRVTLMSESPDTDLVALRLGADFIHRRRARLHLVSETNNGDGTFTRVFERAWTVQPYFGPIHVGIDAMTRGTVYSDTEPYAVHWWGVPCRVLRSLW